MLAGLHFRNSPSSRACLLNKTEDKNLKTCDTITEINKSKILINATVDTNLMVENVIQIESVTTISADGSVKIQ